MNRQKGPHHLSYMLAADNKNATHVTQSVISAVGLGQLSGCYLV